MIVWPWDHVALAYLSTSLHRRLVGERPDRPVALAALAGAVGPDLVDKPLAWVVGVLPSGTSLAHSLLICLPVLLVTRRQVERPVWAGFAAGYLSHLAADAGYGYVTPGPAYPSFLLWPVLAPPPTVPGDAVGTVAALVDAMLYFLSTPGGRLFAVVDLAFLCVTLGVWLADGSPGLHP